METYPSFMLYGLSRSGKTYQCKHLADAGYKVLLMSAEPDGLECIREEIENGSIVLYSIESHEGVCREISALATECPYDVVFLDSLTSLNSLELDELRRFKNKNEPWKARIDRNDRGTASDLLENVFRWFKAMVPAVRVLLAVEEASIKRAEGEVEEWDTGPALPGKARYRWPPLVTEFYRAVSWIDEAGNERWGLVTRASDGHPAGSRYRPRIDISPVEENLAVVLRKIGIGPKGEAASEDDSKAE